jgi:hypothetical protein
MDIKIADGLGLDAQTIATGRGCVIGQSGSGKSYLVGVIAEELCENSLPFVIIDTEGEYASLRQLYEVLIVGDEGSSDISTDVNMQKLFLGAVSNGISIVLDVSNVLDKQKYVQDALQSLYMVEDKARKPYLVIIEEADKFAPNVITRKNVNMIEEIAVRGRKRGIGLLVATQRPANISKNVLSQCSYGFVGKLSIENDIRAVSILFNDRSRLNQITRLMPGNFMSFGLGKDSAVKVRRRKVEHMGGAPQVPSMQNHPNIRGLVKMLKSGVQAAQQVAQKGAKQGQTHVERSIEKKVDSDTARAVITKMLKKQFGIFGRTSETIESLDLKYIEADIFNIRIPTRRKSEYMQKVAILKGSYILEIDGRIKLKDSGIEKPIALNSVTDSIFSVLSKKHKAHEETIAKESGQSFASVSRELKRLLDAEILQQKNDTIIYKDNSKLFPDIVPATVEEHVDQNSLLKIRRLEGVSSKQVLMNVLPTAQIIDQGKILVPVYEAVLRQESRVRILHVDAVSGRLLEI